MNGMCETEKPRMNTKTHKYYWGCKGSFLEPEHNSCLFVSIRGSTSAFLEMTT